MKMKETAKTFKQLESKICDELYNSNGHAGGTGQVMKLVKKFIKENHNTATLQAEADELKDGINKTVKRLDALFAERMTTKTDFELKSIISNLVELLTPPTHDDRGN